MGAGVQAPRGRCRQRIRHDGCHDYPRPSTWRRGNRGDPETACRGRSRGGLRTQRHAPCEALGNPPRFHLTPGPASALTGAAARLPDLVPHARAGLADRAYEAQERVLDGLKKAAGTMVTPPTAKRRPPRPYDKYLYQARHLIENFFAKLKQ